GAWRGIISTACSTNCGVAERISGLSTASPVLPRVSATRASCSQGRTQGIGQSSTLHTAPRHFYHGLLISVPNAPTPAIWWDGLWCDKQAAATVIIPPAPNPATPVPVPDRLCRHAHLGRQLFGTQHPGFSQPRVAVFEPVLAPQL